MKISCEMKIQIFHRYNLCVSAACSTTFDAETRSQRRLTQRNQCFFIQLCHSLSKSHRGCSLPLPCRSWVDCSYKYKFPIRSVFYCLPQFIRKLGFVFSIQFQIILLNPNTCSHLFDWFHHCLLCNLNVCFHLSSSFELYMFFNILLKLFH